MRQWLLKKSGWSLIDAKVIHYFVDDHDKPSQTKTHLLYEKNGRFKVVKINEGWSVIENYLSHPSRNA